MSDALEHVRYSCGIAGKEVANYVDQLQAKIAELEAEVERLKRTNSSYANLTKAQESQLTNLRQRLYQLKGADSAIDSERQANCDLTEQLAKAEQRVAELEAENELLKGRKNVELAANTDNAKSKQQRELAGPMEMGQLLAGSTHKTSGDLEIERTKPVTWIHKGGGFISDSRGKFIGCFSGDFRYRDRIICAVNSESETSNQLAAEQLNNKMLRKALEAVIKVHGYESGIPVEALSTQASTKELDAYVKQKIKEYY